VQLTDEWRKYGIGVGGRDLSYILGGFGWVASQKDNPAGAIFFVDDIQYELSSRAREERLNQPRFLQSFATAPQQQAPAPVDKFDLALRNTAFVYDNALVLLAFLAHGTEDSLRRARLIGDAFVYAQDHDRRPDLILRDAYSAGDLTLPDGWLPNGRTETVPVPGFYDEGTQTFYELHQGGISVGNAAWEMIALLALHRRTQDLTYLNAARRVGEFIRSFKDDDPVNLYQGFRGGMDNPDAGQETRVWASAEHNLDVYAAFSRMFDITGEMGWIEDAEHARIFVEDMWDDSVVPGVGCYWPGTIDPGERNEMLGGQLPLDVQPWAALAIPTTLSDHPDVLDCPDVFHADQHAGFSGFDFNDDLDGVWFEGTAHMATALAHAGKAARAAAIRETLQRAQRTRPFGDRRGIVAAAPEDDGGNEGGLSSGFGFDLFRRPHIAATAWHVFAQLQWNPFYAEPIP
jgi:hypothetical protein